MNNSKQIHFEWIGAVPSNWELRKIKYIFMERKEMNNPIKSKNLISLTMDKGVIPHSEKEGGGNKPKEDLSKYKLVYPGDVVLNSMNVIAGAVGLSKYFGVVSPVYYMLKLLDKNSKAEYFNYLFRTEIFQKSLYGLGNGILIKENEDTGKLNTIRMRISMNKLGNQFIPVPPNKEQELIVEYLDLKTQKIDFLVKKIQEKIEFLEEQKLAFINQYVTKGLNQNIEMKDSEVDWIGLMPKEWETRKLKYIIESLNSGVSVNAEDIPIKSVNEFGVLKTSCVYSNIFNFNENKKVFKEEISRVKCPVKGNSIIISRMNTPNLVGSSGYVEKDFDNIFLPDRL